MKSVFIHLYMPVEMLIEWPEGIVDLGITTKEFLGEFGIILEN